MSFCLVNSTHNFPCTLIYSVVAYEALVITFSVKYLNNIFVPALLKVTKISLKSVICNSLSITYKWKILNIVIAKLPVEYAVIKVFNTCCRCSCLFLSILILIVCASSLSCTETSCHEPKTILLITWI